MINDAGIFMAVMISCRHPHLTLPNGEGRQINHHGHTMVVGVENGDEEAAVGPANDRVTNEDMTQRDEERLVSARKAFYDHSVVSNINYVALLNNIGKA